MEWIINIDGAFINVQNVIKIYYGNPHKLLISSGYAKDSVMYEFFARMSNGDNILIDTKTYDYHTEYGPKIDNLLISHISEILNMEGKIIDAHVG